MPKKDPEENGLNESDTDRESEEANAEDQDGEDEKQASNGTAIVMREVMAKIKTCCRKPTRNP